MEFPETLKSGEVARLFPVIAETGKEQRASSIFLSVLSAVPPLSSAILSQLGPRIGSRTSVNTYTEVVFHNESDGIKKGRPDGLIEVVTGKRKWSALIEAKIGGNPLEADQIERYLRLARENSLDAVITISNAFSARPDHHPITVSKQLTRRVALYHLSWTSILTSAVLLQEQAAISDPEQAFLLREFIRFFSHPSAGISSFTSMPQDWTTAVERIQAGGNVGRTNIGEVVVSAWHQELRDLSLRMSRIIGCEIQTKLSRAHEAEPTKRIKDNVDDLYENGLLTAAFEIPNAAADLQITADLRSRVIRASMNLDAPRELKKNVSRANWLLRQLKDVNPEHVSVGVIWASRASDSLFGLADLRKQPDIVGQVTHGSEIRAFEVILTTYSARRFAGRRTFIEELEDLAPRFYETIGQHLQTWTPSPPKPKHSVTKADSSEPEQSQLEKPDIQPSPQHAGNSHSELLEIPDFLVRPNSGVL